LKNLQIFVTRTLSFSLPRNHLQLSSLCSLIVTVSSDYTKFNYMKIKHLLILVNYFWFDLGYFASGVETATCDPSSPNLSNLSFDMCCIQNFMLRGHSNNTWHLGKEGLAKMSCDKFSWFLKHFICLFWPVVKYQSPIWEDFYALKCFNTSYLLVFH
jgi:hypothetical protein